MKKNYLKCFVSTATGLLLMTEVSAGTPVWTFSAPRPANITISPEETKIVEYTITNHSSRSKNLVLVTWVANSPEEYPLTLGLGSPGCSLPAKGTCIIKVTVDGSQVPVSGIHRGPYLCEKGNLNQCYQPALSNSLSIDYAPPVPVPVPVPIAPAIAAGVYQTLPGLQYPLVASSIDGKWTYTVTDDTPEMPADFLGYSALRDSSCSGLSCVAVGDYRTGLQSSYPLVAHSSDGGATWAYVVTSSTPVMPNDNRQSNSISGLSSASCSGSNCITVGDYYANSDIQYPLAARSGDGGATWTYVITSSTPGLPSDFISDGNLQGSSCSGSNCIVSGGYNYLGSGKAFYPLLAHSSDGGATWAYVITGSSPQLPNNYLGGGFQNASCSGSNCIAAGGYTNTFPAGLIGYPLLAASSDGGISWAYKISETTLTLPADYQTDGMFDSASCSGLNCVAAGNYINDQNLFSPLLARSGDGGTTWAYVITGSTPALPADCSDGAFVGANCSGLNCVAAGYCKNNNGDSFPLLASSNDGGVTWAYVITSNKPTLPADAKNGGLNSASCNDLNCFASGSYSTDNGFTYPLLAASNDGGKNWVYSITSSAPKLPDNLTGGSFSSGVNFTSAIAGSVAKRMGTD